MSVYLKLKRKWGIKCKVNKYSRWNRTNLPFMSTRLNRLPIYTGYGRTYPWINQCFNISFFYPMKTNSMTKFKISNLEIGITGWWVLCTGNILRSLLLMDPKLVYSMKEYLPPFLELKIFPSTIHYIFIMLLLRDLNFCSRDSGTSKFLRICSSSQKIINWKFGAIEIFKVFILKNR